MPDQEITSEMKKILLTSDLLNTGSCDVCQPDINDYKFTRAYAVLALRGRKSNSTLLLNSGLYQYNDLTGCFLQRDLPNPEYCRDSLRVMKTKNILHSVSSFVSIKKATGTQGTRKLIINAIKALHYDQVGPSYFVQTTYSVFNSQGGRTYAPTNSLLFYVFSPLRGAKTRTFDYSGKAFWKQ